MSITSEKRQILLEEYRAHDKDTGSSELQVAILTERIRNLTDHMKVHKHDFHSRRGLIMLVSRRKRLLAYIKSRDMSRYTTLIKKLGIRG